MALALGRQGLGHLGMSETFPQELCEGIIGEEPPPPKNNQVTDCCNRNKYTVGSHTVIMNHKQIFPSFVCRRFPVGQLGT